MGSSVICWAVESVLKLRRGGIDHCRAVADFHRLDALANLQGNVGSGSNVQFDLHILKLSFRKARGRHSDSVSPGGQVNDAIFAADVVCAVFSTPVASLCAITVAFGITAPLAS